MLLSTLFRRACVAVLVVCQLAAPLGPQAVDKHIGVHVFKTTGAAWLHAPKTSSSFCMTLQHVFDKKRFEEMLVAREKGDWSVAPTTYHGCISLKDSFHVPHQWHEPWSSTFHKWVGFFREPRARLISAFFDYYHHEGLPPEQFHAAMHGTGRMNVTSRFEKYLTKFDMRGCQVKMLNGLECHEQVELTPKMVERALARLRKFIFVGVTDRYAEGVKAFHIVMQQGTKPSKLELANHRSGVYPKADKEACLQWMRDTGFEDPYDNRVYQVATELFNHTLWEIEHGKYRKGQIAGSSTRQKIRPRERVPARGKSKHPPIH